MNKIKKIFRDGSKWVLGDNINKIYDVDDSRFIDYDSINFMKDNFEKVTEDEEWGSPVVNVMYERISPLDVEGEYRIVVSGSSLSMCRVFNDTIISRGILCRIFGMKSLSIETLESFEFEKL